MNPCLFTGVDERLQGKDLPQDSMERDRYLAETLQALSITYNTKKNDVSPSVCNEGSRYPLN